jgi:Potato inhibitor I family
MPEPVEQMPEIGGIEKVSWPELVGEDVHDAVKRIETERPDLIMVNPVKDGSIVSMDYAIRRVRVFYSGETGKVVRPPRVG